MVFGLYISGNEYSGKTTVCLGLALKFKEMGLNVGYFKPVGSITSKPVEGTKDEDITLFKELLNLDLDHEVLCPISVRMDYVAQLSKSNTKDLMNKVIQSYKEVSEGRDVVIIESSNLPETLNFKGLSSPDIARKIHALILLVIKADRESVVDPILHYRDYFKQEGSKTLGTVLTMVPPHLKEKMETLVSPILTDLGLPVYGIFEKRPEMWAPSILEVTQSLNATSIVEAGDIAAPVERFVVGAMSPASALDHFTDAGEKAVILTGDRAEVALAALETSTALLIMTGNVEPNPRILETARAKGVPVILTGMSTFNVVAKMSELTGKIKPEQAQKIAMAKTAIDTEVNWIKFLNDLPLKKNPIVKEYLGKVQTKEKSQK